MISKTGFIFIFQHVNVKVHDGRMLYSVKGIDNRWHINVVDDNQTLIGIFPEENILGIGSIGRGVGENV